MKYTLYPWQIKCLDNWYRNRYHGIINVVTGSGKTILALAAAMQLMEKVGKAGLRVKIVVPTASLLNQWTTVIPDFFDGQITRSDIGLYYSGYKNAPDHPFMIYVINSARYCIARHIINDIQNSYTVLMIADECHRYTGEENRKIFDFIPFVRNRSEQYASLGLSATPGLDRPENAEVLIPALGREIFRYGLKEATENQTLCSYATFHIALSFTEEERQEYEDLSLMLSKAFSSLISRYSSLKSMKGSDFFQQLARIAGNNGEHSHLARTCLNLSYRRKYLTSDASSRIRCVLKLIGLLGENDKIIVFGERIQQADSLYEQLNSLYPGRSARYHSGLSPQARKLSLERFHNGEVRILISCRALDEGFDVPAANVGIVMSSASVNRQRVQRLGRILRRFEGKDMASLYYLHIAESSEEHHYFPSEARAAALCELSYRMDTDRLYHPDYEKRSRAVLRSFLRENSSKELLAEARSCMRCGLVRPDWLFDHAYYGKKIDNAASTAERNYWICMRQIALKR